MNHRIESVDVAVPRQFGGKPIMASSPRLSAAAGRMPSSCTGVPVVPIVSCVTHARTSG